MLIDMKRIDYTNNSTIGEFKFDGQHYYTLEDVVRPVGAPKVYGQTAIPFGTYQLAMTMSNRFKIVMPLLLNVPGFEGVRIHSGNRAADTDGCILLGKDKGLDIVSNSRVACDAFYKSLANALKTNQVFIRIS